MVWGKCSTKSKTSIAHNHSYVAREQANPLVDALRREIRGVDGETERDQKCGADYGRIVNSRHFDRLSALLDDATSRGALVLEGGVRDPDQKYLSPTQIGGTDTEMAISREAIFGPILPVIEYDIISRVIDTINTGPKPTALYIFSKHATALETIIDRTR